MVKCLKTPRGKGVRQPKISTSAKPKLSRVTETKGKTAPTRTPLKTPRHGMKTRARAAEIYDQCERYQKHGVSSSPQAPKTPESTGLAKIRQKGSIRSILSPNRSFWDAVKTAAREQQDAASQESGFDNTNIAHILNRLSNSITTQFDSYKYENFGFLSSSPSGYDPRELRPASDEEIEDLRTAIWLTIQHVFELTNCRIRFPDPKDDYLTQLRHVREQLRDSWQNAGLPGNAPAPFQLEAWRGGISNWRSSTYTDGGDHRFPASMVEAQLQAELQAEMPSLPAPHDDDDILDPEVQIVGADRCFHRDGSSSPTPSGHRCRRPMAALYDRNRDSGFLPTASRIEAFQHSTTALPSLPVADTDTGIPNSDFDFESYFDELPFPPHRHTVSVFEDQNSPNPPPPTSTTTEDYDATEGSDKENDSTALMRQQRAEI
ncbi:MAG: hypothetical protein L6R39_005065, partial [Caloplaca ligustica]